MLENASRGLTIADADAKASEMWQKKTLPTPARNVLDFRLYQMQNVTQEDGVSAVQGSNRFPGPNTG